MHRLQTLFLNNDMEQAKKQTNKYNLLVPTVMGSWRFYTLTHSTSMNNTTIGVF